MNENQLSNLRSHAFGTCELCGAYVDDPEALKRCPNADIGPSEKTPTTYHYEDEKQPDGTILRRAVMDD